MLHVKLRVTDLALGLAYSTMQDMALTDVTIVLGLQDIFSKLHDPIRQNNSLSSIKEVGFFIVLLTTVTRQFLKILQF